MESLNANMLNELQKLFMKKKTIVFLIIMSAVSFLSALFLSSIRAKLVFIALNSLSFPLMLLSVFTSVFLPLFIFMAASELFSGEVADRTLKLVLTQPISRLKIYISKLSAIAVYILLNLVVIFTVSVISAICLHISITNISGILLSYLIDAVPAIILAVFASFIAQFFKSSSAALISCLLIFIALNIFSFFTPSLGNNIFTSYLDWSSIWFSGTTRALNLLLLLLSYGIIFFTGGYYLFDRKEI